MRRMEAIVANRTVDNRSVAFKRFLRLSAARLEARQDAHRCSFELCGRLVRVRLAAKHRHKQTARPCEPEATGVGGLRKRAPADQWFSYSWSWSRRRASSADDDSACFASTHVEICLLLSCLVFSSLAWLQGEVLACLARRASSFQLSVVSFQRSKVKDSNNEDNSSSNNNRLLSPRH